MKVVHIITRFIKGGADFNTLHTLEGLSNEYETYLITGTERDKELITNLKKINVNNFKVGLRHYDPISSFISLFKIFIILKKLKPIIVHTHSTEAGIVGRWAAWFASVPIIIHTIHGVPFNRNFFARKILILFEKITAKITTKIISNANIITEKFLEEKIGTPDKYITIYSGVDLDKIKNSKPDLVIKRRKKIKVLCASRLVEGKGLEDFIELAKRVNQQSKSFEFYLAGDGPLRTKLVKLAKENVIFLGHCENLPSIMKSCTLFILPSYREGTPRVITEALACGLPVIATNIDGIPEQIMNEKNGILFSPGDVDFLEKLVVGENWRQIKPSLNPKFGKKCMISELRAIYNKTISNLKNKYCNH